MIAGKVVLGLAVVIAACAGMIAGIDRTQARRELATAREALSRSEHLRDEVDRLRVRFADVKRDLDAASTPAAATAARAALFQLRVDMVAVEDEIDVLARRSPAARDF